MRDDRPVPGREQITEQALDAQRILMKAKLDEQVAPAIEGQQPPLAQQAPKISIPSESSSGMPASRTAVRRQSKRTCSAGEA